LIHYNANQQQTDKQQTKGRREEEGKRG